MTRFKHSRIEYFYIAALKRAIWNRIEEEVWRRDRIEHRATTMGKTHYFALQPSEKLKLSKRDLRFLKNIKVKV